jgi:hypothetical protein
MTTWLCFFFKKETYNLLYFWMSSLNGHDLSVCLEAFSPVVQCWSVQDHMATLVPIHGARFSQKIKNKIHGARSTLHTLLIKIIGVPPTPLYVPAPARIIRHQPYKSTSN